MQALRLTRPAFALSILALMILGVGFAFLAEDLGLERYTRSIRTGLSSAFLLSCAARLADAGFRFLRSFIWLIVICAVLPFVGFFAYAYFVGLPPASAGREEFILMSAVVAGIILMAGLLIFCMAFPSAGPNDSAGGPGAHADDDLLNWTPRGHTPAQKTEPRL